MSNLSKTSIIRGWFEIAISVAVVIADALGLVPITQTIYPGLG